ncbi:carboxymuconolactone decarboxylase family protein [Salipiger abyssi]|uniref:4-carboxymuconolactone decarboxylase n=1 Tax=Salipiger abyssi TaxID=1250539 RepID=A0A1P8V0R6_9RHOB|nr:carboxymuconolactone decarboxylase family protein [Salipiger abyssi]APZ55243.1 4-carboxymuconolactone decarboxylase [Salipiger abyssi]MBN9889306.1 carboxymuconolactone decarboxylase family protein [Salipiger abyssi]
MADRNSNAGIYEAVPQFGRLRDEVLYNDVWKQPELSPRDRSLVTCAVLAALGKNEELRHHMGVAVENGVTADELRGLVVQVAFYGGWPCGVNAAKAGMPIFEKETG